jgi:hypothetical protein
MIRSRITDVSDCNGVMLPWSARPIPQVLAIVPIR